MHGELSKFWLYFIFVVRLLLDVAAVASDNFVLCEGPGSHLQLLVFGLFLLVVGIPLLGVGALLGIAAGTIHDVVALTLIIVVFLFLLRQHVAYFLFLNLISRNPFFQVFLIDGRLFV